MTAKGISSVGGHTIRLCLCVIACLILCVPVGRALADDDLTVHQLRVQVLPEFDDPRVLVVVQGRLAEPPGGFPVRVTFRLPTIATVNQMANLSMDRGSAEPAPFELQPDPNDARFLLASYTLRDAHFFYEYYYNPLPDSADKAFGFTYSSLYRVDDVLVEVQQPRTATAFEVVPAPASSRHDARWDLTHHQVPVGSLPPGGESAVQVRYTKANSTPSLTWNQVMALQTMDLVPGARAAPLEGTDEPPAATWGAGALLLGLGLVAAGGLFCHRAVARNRLPPSPATAHDGDRALCGVGLKRAASFCHRCGSPVSIVGNSPSSG